VSSATPRGVQTPAGPPRLSIHSSPIEPTAFR